jgi:hypothetical protein
MQELLGRLTALDPSARETLTVITYFDTLIEAHATSEMLVRGACILTGCAVGFVADRTVLRVTSTGEVDRSAVAPDPEVWPGHPIAGTWRVWLEREGDAHVNDAMVLERLALGLGIVLERTHPAAIARRSLEVLLDSESTVEDRASAASKLRLNPTTALRMVALDAADPFGSEHHNVELATPVGRVRAVLVLPGATLPAARIGIGVSTVPASLRESWLSALLALRLTTAREPVVDAASLGAFLLLAETSDSRDRELPDVAVLAAIDSRDPRALGYLDALGRSDSVRSAATLAGIHHSTLQAHAAESSAALGFDVRSPEGRVRLALALRLHRLARYSADERRSAG